MSYSAVCNICMKSNSSARVLYVPCLHMPNQDVFISSVVGAKLSHGMRTKQVAGEMLLSNQPQTHDDASWPTFWPTWPTYFTSLAKVLRIYSLSKIVSSNRYAAEVAEDV